MNIIEESDSLDDWYVLRGPHTTVEGTSQEWRELLNGMMQRKDVRHRRAAVYYRHGFAILFSPRNSHNFSEDVALIADNEIEQFVAESLKVIASTEKTTIVCLCGSTRFIEAFQRAELNETLAGKIVLTIGCNTKSDGELLASGELFVETKKMLDALHLKKIELADEVLILNVGGYIGESTRNEIEHAKKHGKVIRYLEAESIDNAPLTH